MPRAASGYRWCGLHAKMATFRAEMCAGIAATAPNAGRPTVPLRSHRPALLQGTTTTATVRAGFLAVRLSLSTLERVHLGKQLDPKSTRQLFQSENLRNLIELDMDFCSLGAGVDVLGDAAVLPNLERCSLAKVPKRVAAALTKKRPLVHCRS